MDFVCCHALMLQVNGYLPGQKKIPEFRGKNVTCQHVYGADHHVKSVRHITPIWHDIYDTT